MHLIPKDPQTTPDHAHEHDHPHEESGISRRRFIVVVICLVGLWFVGLFLANEVGSARTSLAQGGTVAEPSLVRLQPDTPDSAEGGTYSTTTANSSLVHEVDAKPSATTGASRHYTPGSTVVGPNAHRRFSTVSDAEQQLNASISTPSYLPDGVALESVKEIPNGGGTAQFYQRLEPSLGVLIIRGGISIKAGGLSIKSGHHSEVSLSNGGRAALIRGGWRGGSWDAEAALTAVVENSNAEKFLVYAIPAAAWTMEEIQRVVDSL